MIFFVITGKMVFLFSQNNDIFSLDEKLNMTFLKKYMEIYFLYVRINVTNMISFCQKKQR